MMKDKTTKPRPAAVSPMLEREMLCLLASYELYGISHAWPCCLGRPTTREASQ